MSAGSSPKRPKYPNPPVYREISHHHSKFAKFNTNEDVSKFVIEDLGVDQMENLSDILRAVIDRAWDRCKAEYGNDPRFYIILINGEGLSDPIIVKANSRENDLDLLMVSNL